MTQFGTRKDGRHYPKNGSSIGMSNDVFRRLREQDARRSNTARAIDRKIKAPIDLEGSAWQAAPNRYDVRGIDDPVTLSKNEASNKRFIAKEIKNQLRMYGKKSKPELARKSRKEREELEQKAQQELVYMKKKQSTQGLSKSDMVRTAKAIALIKTLDSIPY
jgi:ribosomal protein L29